MPYRDRATVEGWVAEWRALDARDAVDIVILDDNFEAGPNSALVVVTFRTASTITHIRPVMEDGSPRWVATFEPRAELIELDQPGLRLLADDMSTLAVLQEFLQAKTDGVLTA
ncbi:protein-L-isoaspartate carboxylmethyltransferase [Microbacterium sp. USHLN186]|uniref:protein-L-isoaspartate carboxylmethyltransferase n=1 Tax=Microbacterium sp. USHLN186 TaxID=3081286 RepID=UPI0030176691